MTPDRRTPEKHDTADGTTSGGAASPLIAVCLRFTDLRPTVDPLTGAVGRELYTAGMSAADTAALERALRIAEAWSGGVLAVTAGLPAADEPLREIAALGADVRRVDWPPSGPDPEPLGSAQSYLQELADDSRPLAAALVTAIRAVGEPALVLCGDRSSDRGTGALPAAIAHLLGAAQALGLVDLRDDGDTLIGERRLDGGRRERLRIPRPAVCSVEGAGMRLRRAGLHAILAAAELTVPVSDPAPGPGTGAGAGAGAAVTVRAGRPYRPRPRVVPPPAGGTPRDRLLQLTGALAAHEPPTIVGPAGPSEAADALLAFLERNGYLAPRTMMRGRPDPAPVFPAGLPWVGHNVS